MRKGLIGIHSTRDALVFCCGSSVLEYRDRILAFIGRRKDLVVIGVNNMTHLYVPEYHLWCNNGRLKQFASCIKDCSTLLLGSHLHPDALACIQSDADRETIYYTDYLWEKPGYVDECIHGSYRVGGNLAIMIAHLMGCGKAYIVGHDGYGSTPSGNQHCWGKGLTDGTDTQYEILKDSLISKSMRKMREHGVEFSIITPTVHTEFYEGGLL